VRRPLPVTRRNGLPPRDARLVTLRLKVLLDYKLQAGSQSNRTGTQYTRLPTSGTTRSDLVNRSWHRIGAPDFTGRVLQALARVVCLFSVGLLLLRLEARLVALLLVIVRAAAILITGAVRIYYESKHFNLSGQNQRICAAIDRWGQQARVQRTPLSGAGPMGGAVRCSEALLFIASQRIGNFLCVRDDFPDDRQPYHLCVCRATGSQLMTNLGAFLGFLAAFGQSTGSLRQFWHRA